MTFPLCLLLLFAILPSSYQNSQAKITYADHCSSIVPQSPFSTMSLAKNISFHFSNAYSIGGENLFSSPTSSSSKNKLRGTVYFWPREIYRTKDPDIYHLSIHLYIGEPSSYSNGMALEPKDLRRPTIYHKGRSFSASFDLYGFWSKSTGKLCMVGSSWSFDGKNNLKHNVMYTMNMYNSPIVSGTIKSLDSPKSSKYFDTISVVGYHKPMDYAYTKLPAAEAMCASLKAPTNSIGFENLDMYNYIQFLTTTFHLEYGKDCIVPLFASSDTKFMSLYPVESSKDGKVTMLIIFTNSSHYDHSVVAGKTLIGEGYWDSNKKLLCVLACPLVEDLSIGKCTIGLSFRFPSVFTVKDRANVLGRIWSTEGKKEPGYFDQISVRSLEDDTKGFIPGVKYEYTKLDLVKKNCEKKNHSYSRFGRYL